MDAFLRLRRYREVGNISVGSSFAGKDGWHSSVESVPNLFSSNSSDHIIPAGIRAKREAKLQAGLKTKGFNSAEHLIISRFYSRPMVDRGSSRPRCITSRVSPSDAWWQSSCILRPCPFRPPDLNLFLHQASTFELYAGAPWELSTKNFRMWKVAVNRSSCFWTARADSRVRHESR